MSVEFVAKIGYGYMLNWDQVRELEEKSEGVWDYLCSTDCYGEENTSFFLGIDLKSLDPGEWVDINELTTVSHDMASEYAYKLTQILANCGIDVSINSDWIEPRIYVWNCVC